MPAPAAVAVARCRRRSSPSCSGVNRWRWPDPCGRDRGFPPASGLALWERYTRDALTGSGRPSRLRHAYEELLADPGAALVAVGPVAARTRAAGGRRRHACRRRRPRCRADWPATSGDGELPEAITHAMQTLPGWRGAARRPARATLGSIRRRGWPTPSPSATTTRSSTPGTCATSGGGGKIPFLGRPLGAGGAEHSTFPQLFEVRAPCRRPRVRCAAAAAPAPRRPRSSGRRAAGPPPPPAASTSPGLHQHPAHPVLDEQPGPVGVGRHHGLARRHGLQHRQTERLGVRGVHDHVGPGHEVVLERAAARRPG